MLAQFVLIVFALFGIMSMVIDLGYVKLTQVQMLNAADAASLEGLRLRNSNLKDGFAADCQRRIAARDMVRRIVQDDVDPVTNTIRVRAGAGPIISFDDEGVGDLNARQDITHQFAMYQPVLQLNGPATTGGGNFEYGDMVSGSFFYTTGSREDASYARPDNDFVRNSVVPAPDTGYTSCPDTVPVDAFGKPTWPEPPNSGPLEGAGDLAFLVRLRRTTDVNGLDKVPGVSTSGPTMPLLFGRGTTIEAPQEGQTYSVRRDGITVRATSIANARPALRVGLPAAGIEGATWYALERDFFASDALTGECDPSSPNALRASVDASGVISTSAGPVGRFVSDRSSISIIGAALPAASAPPLCATFADHVNKGYGPVYTTIGPSATNRIIGFGRVELFWWNCDAGDETSVTMCKHNQIVSVANASAQLSGGLPDSTMPRAEIALLMSAVQDLAWIRQLSILAPALAR